MAVQQNKKSPSKRGMHRAHDFLTAPALAVEASTGEVHLRHHISPNGFYRGRKVVKAKANKLLLRRHGLSFRPNQPSQAVPFARLDFSRVLLK